MILQKHGGSCVTCRVAAGRLRGGGAFGGAGGPLPAGLRRWGLDQDNAGLVLERAWAFLDRLSVDASAWLANVPVAARGEGTAQTVELPGTLSLLRRVVGHLPESKNGNRQIPATLSRDWQACAEWEAIHGEAEQAFPGEVNAGDHYLLEFEGCHEDGGVLNAKVIL